MSTLFPKTISYNEITGGYVSGIWTPNAPVAKTFEGSVQPITGKDLVALEVGREDLGKVKVYSSTPLKVSTEGREYSGDIVIWQDKEWELIQAMDFQNDLINHYKYIAEFRKDTS